jgi:hypothetical protein
MSTKTTADKLQIKPNTTVWASDFARLDLVRPLPDGVRRAYGPAEATTALVFADDAASLKAILDDHRDDVTAPGTFWVAYPKASKSDINRDSLWPIVSDYGMRPNGQISIDDTWSALRFRPDKPGEAPFNPPGR